VKKYIVQRANAIIAEYAAAGLDLTLRQLYYQFIAREWFPDEWKDPTTGSKNNEKSYKRLGDIIGEARMAGYIDWNSITDRTRNLRKRAEWAHPNELINAAAAAFRIDRWANQPVRPEVWIEKDALVGVIEAPCESRGVAYFSCRGYTSMSEIWVAAQRIGHHILNGQRVVIYHLGDHDPSGVDMSRDINDRLFEIVMRDLVRHQWLTAEKAGALDDRVSRGEPVSEVYPFWVERIALTMEQVERFNPPPNPAKLTDARAKKYVSMYGDESWELDALDPRTIIELVEGAIDSNIVKDKWEASRKIEESGRSTLATVHKRFDDVVKFVNKAKG
jgi:hypothetical protein